MAKVNLKGDKIFFSATSWKDVNKSASSGFIFSAVNTLEQLIKVWDKYSISQAVYSEMIRYYDGKWRPDNRRRIHNISFVGNLFIYDFDDGHISMQEFYDMYENQFTFACVKSKNDHKYSYDRFKVVVVHDSFFVQSLVSDNVPAGFKKKHISEYKDFYIMFAENFGFWKWADQATIDVSRLSSNVASHRGLLICSI